MSSYRLVYAGVRVELCNEAELRAFMRLARRGPGGKDSAILDQIENAAMWHFHSKPKQEAEALRAELEKDRQMIRDLVKAFRSTRDAMEELGDYKGKQEMESRIAAFTLNFPHLFTDETQEPPKRDSRP